MFESFKVVTTRGQTYVFSGREGKLDADIVGETFIRLRRNRVDVALFPLRNVEAFMRLTDIDGEVAS